MHYRGTTDKQKRKGKILCIKTKRKRKPAPFPEAMNGYREEEVWKGKGCILAAKSGVKLRGLCEASTNYNLSEMRWNVSKV